MNATALAPAKINLFLHVGAVQNNGYHPLSSLAVFADVGDRISLQPSDRFEVVVSGPFASGVPADGNNLIARAVAALGGSPPSVRVVLEKRLPVAAGLGGGSSDAAAALRLLKRESWIAPAPEALMAATDAIGADGAACMAARPVVMQGRGDHLAEAPGLPQLHAVLINPGEACATGSVYRAYDARDPRSANLPAMPPAFSDAAAMARWLKSSTRNDLEAAAQEVQPAITGVLRWLAGRAEPLLVRMSGSGATCFAIAPDAASAQALVRAAVAERPNWWSVACRLGNSWSAQGNLDVTAA